MHMPKLYRFTKHTSRLIVAVLMLTSPLRAEIFADFTLSQNGDPLGTFRVELFHQQAPRAVANFVGLASGDLPWLDPSSNRLRQGVPFYDGLIFHRLIHDFMIQGGDPLGTGSGGPGYVFQDQFHPDLRHDGPYYLSMAHSGPNSNGSQFFITLANTSFLDDYHSVFGRVISGTGIIDGFMDPDLFPTIDPGSNDRPIDAIVIESVILSGSALTDFRADSSSTRPAALAVRASDSRSKFSG
jgi:peptidyl-prolyl cis-trans isomerase A (cyclophilin A)